MPQSSDFCTSSVVTAIPTEGPSNATMILVTSTSKHVLQAHGLRLFDGPVTTWVLEANSCLLTPHALTDPTWIQPVLGWQWQKPLIDI